MLVIGGVLFLCWVAWDGFYAEYPIMPKRVLNRTFVGDVNASCFQANSQFACLAIDFFYFFSSYLVDAYFLSWVYIIVDWNVGVLFYRSNRLTARLETMDSSPTLYP